MKKRCLIGKACVGAFAMFSRIPMPQVPWDTETQAYLLCAFPLVGLVIGGVDILWLHLMQAFACGPLLTAAGLTLLPLAITGGVHLDGFCDTVDALACHGSPEQRRQILKDPHAGAFAIIGAGMYLVAYTACSSELPKIGTAPWLLALSFLLSRSLSGLVSLAYPQDPGEGLLYGFRTAAKKKPALGILALWSLLAGGSMLILAPLQGGLMLLSALLVLVGLFRMARRKFQGISGDLSGWFLQCVELAMLAALIFSEKVGTG